MGCDVREVRTDDLMVPSDLKCYAFIWFLNEMSLNFHFTVRGMSEKAGKTCVVVAALVYALNPLKYGHWGL